MSPPVKIVATMKKRRTSDGSTSKYSPSPPQTPASMRSDLLRYRRCEATDFLLPAAGTVWRVQSLAGRAHPGPRLGPAVRRGRQLTETMDLSIRLTRWDAARWEKVAAAPGGAGSELCMRHQVCYPIRGI